MKASCLCLLFATLIALAEMRGPLPTVSNFDKNAARGLQAGFLRDPYRKINGKTHDLTPLFTWTRDDGSGLERPNQEWFALYGTVIQITEKGMLVRAYEKAWKGNSQTIFLKNLPHNKETVDGNNVVGIVTKTGRYQYKTTIGAMATVEEYDYGELPTPEEVAELKQKKAERLADLTNEISQLRAARKQIDEEGKRAALPKIIAFQQKQASNGYPTFQLELGKRYLRGDGVETNLALARHWLQSACTNGESQASNLLMRITND